MSSEMEEFRVCGITARLFKIILRMSEQEQKTLFAKIGDQRIYERIPYLMQITCETDVECFHDFILDVSAGGIFLETVKDLSIGQDVTLIMEFRNHPDPMAIKGDVVWKGINGVGIQFRFDSPEQQAQMERLVAGLG